MKAYRIAQVALVTFTFLILMLNPLPLFQLITGAVTPNGGISVRGQYGWMDALLAVALIGGWYTSWMLAWAFGRNAHRKALR